MGGKGVKAKKAGRSLRKTESHELVSWDHFRVAVTYEVERVVQKGTGQGLFQGTREVLFGIKSLLLF